MARRPACREVVHHRSSQHAGTCGGMELARGYLAVLQTQLCKHGDSSSAVRPTSQLVSIHPFICHRQSKCCECPQVIVLDPSLNGPDVCRYGLQAAVGFVPTGWTFQMKAERFPVHEKPPWKVHLIPYSEHSSFAELQEFVGFLRPKNIVPTVGVSGDQADAAAHTMVSHFRNLCDHSGAKKAFLGALIAAAEDRERKGRCSSIESGPEVQARGAGEAGEGAGDSKQRDEDTQADQKNCQHDQNGSGLEARPIQSSEQKASCSRAAAGTMQDQETMEARVYWSPALVSIVYGASFPSVVHSRIQAVDRTCTMVCNRDHVA